jgi:hypothetical protein
MLGRQLWNQLFEEPPYVGLDFRQRIPDHERRQGNESILIEIPAPLDAPTESCGWKA